MLYKQAQEHSAGGKTLGVGIGVHCGTVIAGDAGSASRMDYTVMGDTVNSISRLQGKAPSGSGADDAIVPTYYKVISKEGASDHAPIITEFTIK